MVAVSGRRLSPVALNAADYGFRVGASAGELKAALAAGLVALPAAGGTLALPAGTYDLGLLTSAAGLVIARSNVTLAGAGIGQTVILYDSDNAGGAYGPGSAILLGDNISTYANITIRDLTLHDQQTTVSPSGGHQPSAIDGIVINNVLVERVDVINAKGNGAITFSGQRATNAPVQEYLTIRDCIIRGTLDGGYIEGDGINVGNYRQVHLVRNRITGVLRHAIEGGLIWYGSISHNQIDMQSLGLCGIGTGSFIHVEINGNSFANLKSDASNSCIACTQDQATDLVGDLAILGNSMISATPTNATFLQWAPLGGLAISAGPVRVLGNHVQARGPVSVQSNPVQLVLQGNVFDLQGSAGPVVSTVGAGPALADTEFLQVQANTIINGHPSSTPRARILSPLGVATNWKSARVRCADQLVYDGAPSAFATANADGGWALDVADLASIAVGAASPERTVLYDGALAGDSVEVYVQSALLATFPRAWVSSPDTISWQLYNMRAAAIDPSSGNYWFRIQRR